MESLLHGHDGDYDSPSSSSSLDNLKPSVLVVILILLITFLFSFFICFLLRCLNRCGHHRQSIASSSAAAAATTDSLRLSGRRVSPEIAAPSVIDSLPVFTFSAVTRRSSAAISGDCAVCLSKFEPQDQLRLLPLCCHAFHAGCIDAWLVSNQTCPLCRSPLFAAESDLLKSLAGGGENSFRLEIGSISSRRQNTPESGEQQRSYSVGSFNYIVDDAESEVSVTDIRRRNTSGKEEDTVTAAVAVPPYESSLAADIGGGSRNWLKDYMDRLSHGISSRALSFRSSGRFFTGSSRRTEDFPAADIEANPTSVGEEIDELFRWLSGV